MKKYINLVVLYFVFGINCNAGDINFTIAAPDEITIGQSIRVSYNINADGNDFQISNSSDFKQAGAYPKALISNPELVNGRVVTLIRSIYVYKFSAIKPGIFKLPTATIVIDGRKYSSQSKTIKVLSSESKKDIKSIFQQKLIMSPNEEMFIRPIITKTRLYEQDYTVITYKLYYSKVDVVKSNFKIPDFEGFLMQKLPINNQIGAENYNGKGYATITLFKGLLYPQKIGKIKIEKTSAEPEVKIKFRSKTPDLFGNYPIYIKIDKKLIDVPSLEIIVDSLHGIKPVNFHGAVGNFKILSSISSSNVNANDAITYSINIYGNGNLKLIKTPKINFPKGFDVFDPKIQNNFTINTNGTSGDKTIEFQIIPRSAGDFVIPSYSFSYFDLSSKTYKTLSTPEYKIHVNKASGSASQTVTSNYTDKDQVKVLATDIRYITHNSISTYKTADLLFGTWKYYLIMISALALMLVVIVFNRKRLIANSDVNAVKNKKANKVAIQRLQKSKEYLTNGNKTAFYDEVMKTLWGYIGDKFAIPAADLNKDTVAEKLNAEGVAESEIKELLAILSECEFAQYAPSGNAHAMDDIYERVIELIGKLQLIIK